MKKLLIVPALIIGFAVIGRAQSKATLEARLERYVTATQEKDWEAIMDLIYPKLFDLVSREQMIEAFRSIDGSGMAFSFGKMEVKYISPFFTLDPEVFARVDYAGNMTIRITDESMQTENMMSLMSSSFQAAYGADKVAVEEENHTFLIGLDKSMFAVADQGSEDWFFIENNAQQEAILDTLIPQAVRDHFNTPQED